MRRTKTPIMTKFVGRKEHDKSGHEPDRTAAVALSRRKSTTRRSQEKTTPSARVAESTRTWHRQIPTPGDSDNSKSRKTNEKNRQKMGAQGGGKQERVPHATNGSAEGEWLGEVTQEGESTTAGGDATLVGAKSDEVGAGTAIASRTAG